MMLYKYSASSKHLSICASNPVVPWVREEESLSGGLRKAGELFGTNPSGDWRSFCHFRLSSAPHYPCTRLCFQRLSGDYFSFNAVSSGVFVSFHVITALHGGFLFFWSSHSLGNYFDYSRGKFASAILRDDYGSHEWPETGLFSSCG